MTMINPDTPGLAEYMAAQQELPDPREIAQRKLAELAAARGEVAGERVLATGPSEYGGVEMLVQKANGVVVLLRPMQPQVKNTPKGPKMVRTQAPDELPLVRRTAPTQMVMALHRAWGRPLPEALLLFQSRFSTVARGINLL